MASFPMLHLPPQLNDSAEDTDRELCDFFIRVKMGLVHAGIGSNERDTFFLLFYAFTVASSPLTRTMATFPLFTSFIAKIHCNLYLEFPTQNIYKSEK